jgi:hypothetical protein
VGEQQDTVDMEDECTERLLAKRDKDDSEWTCESPAPCQQRIPHRQRHCEIQETPDSQIVEREVIEIQIRKPFRRHDAPMQR